jgi:uncharacterized protein YkwD
LLNPERKTRQAKALRPDSRLEKTAQERANTLAKRYENAPRAMGFQ